MGAIALDMPGLYRWNDKSADPGEPLLEDVQDVEIPGIRCPLCKWRPKRSDTWMCWDCDHPEYFYAGCGTAWNTFDTGGVCPTCSHKWKWTSCFGCFMWSKHEDWYEEIGRFDR